MDIAALISPIMQIGIAPVLLLFFVKYFFDKDKARESQIKELTVQFEKREGLLRSDMARREEQYKERERLIVAESASREEMIKREAEKREKIINEAAAKREAALLHSIDSFKEAIDSIRKAINEIPAAMVRLQDKVDAISDMIGKES